MRLIFLYELMSVTDDRYSQMELKTNKQIKMLQLYSTEKILQYS